MEDWENPSDVNARGKKTKKIKTNIGFFFFHSSALVSWFLLPQSFGFFCLKLSENKSLKNKSFRSTSQTQQASFQQADPSNWNVKTQFLCSEQLTPLVLSYCVSLAFPPPFRIYDTHTLHTLQFTTEMIRLDSCAAPIKNKIRLDSALTEFKSTLILFDSSTDMIQFNTETIQFNHWYDLTQFWYHLTQHWYKLVLRYDSMQFD